MFKADSKNNQSCCAVSRAQTRGKLPVFFLRQGAGGYTLVEVMIAVTLTLILMYALAAIFGRVTSMMTQTQDILSMTNNLRTAKDRLREDLENLTVPTLKAPTSRYGFFSYSEGQGNAPVNIEYDQDENGVFHAMNSRTYSTYGNFDRRTPSEDNTVGDTDDILSFTVRAPAGKWFRGRCFKELSETYTSDYDASIDDNIEMIEAEYAEVIWFLRGTTLYRRVLLVIPDEVLEKRLQSLNRYIQYNFPVLADHQLLPSAGFGFYRFFDVSVHFDPDKTLSYIKDSTVYPSLGRVVANTVSDLANRENRYGYWSSPVVDLNSVAEQFPLLDHPAYDGIYGRFGAWYWMRLPTLQESALWTPFPDSDFWPLEYFRAGFPFGCQLTEPYEQHVSDVLNYWVGGSLRLGLGHIGPNPDSGVAFDNSNLPDDVFIDDWQFPNPWVQQVSFSGQIDLTKIVKPVNLDMRNLSEQQTRQLRLANLASLDEVKNYNNDVLLTNVLSFDVKVWNNKDGVSGSFVDLGEDDLTTGAPVTDPADFRSCGNYRIGTVFNPPPLCDPATHELVRNNLFYRPIMPAVFDTWTEDYQKEFLSQTWPGNSESENVFGASSRPGFTVGDIPLDGNVTAADLPDYPPPYEAEVKVIQVELRAFDPVSRTIKNATVEIKIP